MRIKSIIVFSLIFSTALAAQESVYSLRGPNWSVGEAGGVSYLMYNDMPYFGRFESDHPKISLDGEWEFAADPKAGEAAPSSGWETVRVPHVWNYIRPDMLHYIGVGWYRKKFTVDENFKGDIVRLAFGGVNMRCRVWLNGKPLGGHEGGYTSFSLNATEALAPGENVLLVRVDNSMTWTSLPPLNYEGSRMGWWEYGGINRSVYLEAHPSPALFKIAVKTLPAENEKWVVTVDALEWYPGLWRYNDKIEFEAEIFDISDGSRLTKLTSSSIDFDNNNNVWAAKLKGEIDSPKLWSPSDPSKKYVVKVNLKQLGKVVDSARVEFGFRHFEANAKGLFLNGKPYYIRGLNRHEDDPVTGSVETPEVLDRDMKLLKELHVNHIRTGHYPNDAMVYDYADKYGIGITEEIPLYQAGMGWGIWFRDRVQRKYKIGPMHFLKVNPTQFTDKTLVDNAVLTLIEMIERDRNHPSILAWSIGNENWTFSSGACSTYETLYNVSKTFDIDRPVTFALLQSMGPLKEKCANIADFISANEYFGWYTGKTEDVEAYLQKMHKAFPNKPIVVSEFGAGCVLDKSKQWPGRRYGEGTYTPEEQNAVISKQWEIIRRQPFIWGGMPWVFADFRNGWYKEIHPIPYFNLKGILTHDRQPKPAFFVLKDIYTDLENNPPQWAK